jgi:hypothetical protein
MALFDRNNNRGYGYGTDHNRGGGFVDRAQNAVRRGWDRVENTFEGQDTGTGYGGMHRGGTPDRPMDRNGGLHQRNSWSDGAWTADAAERTDREWAAGNRGRMGYDRDMNDSSPTQAGWRAGGMSGGMGMNRGGMDRDRGWNLGGGEWGHTGNLNGGMNRYDRGFAAGGTHHGGFLDRAQNAVRRGWDNVEDRFDRDDTDRGMSAGSMRGGTSWAGQYDRDFHQPSDLRGYRDGGSHYGVTHSPGMMGGNAGMGMNRYSSDFDRGRMDRDRMDLHRGGMDYDRGYKSREQTDAGDPFGDRQNHTPIRMTGGARGNPGRYDENYRGSRDWF